MLLTLDIVIIIAPRAKGPQGQCARSPGFAVAVAADCPPGCPLSSRPHGGSPSPAATLFLQHTPPAPTTPMRRPADLFLLPDEVDVESKSLARKRVLADKSQAHQEGFLEILPAVAASWRWHLGGARSSVKGTCAALSARTLMADAPVGSVSANSGHAPK